MINEYTKELTNRSASNNIPKDFIEMQDEYRKAGFPTILTDGLTELLLMLSIKNPKTLLELGTSTGCSSIAMLKTLKDLKIVTVEKIPEIQAQAIENFKKFGVADRVESLLGDSVEVVKSLNQKFDFIFLDCNKAAYPKVYPYLKNMLNEGGVLFADNVVFRGYCSGEAEAPKEYRTLIQKIQKFNDMVSADKDLITCFFDVGDGISVSVKK